MLAELARRRVEREEDVLPGPVAGALDGAQHEVERRLVAGQARGKAALVAHARRETLVLEQLLQRVEDLDADAEGLAEGARARRHDHELLDVQTVVGVRAAVEHVHHGHRHDPGARPAQVLVERQAALVGAGARDGQRHAEERVGAEARLVRRAVELEQRAVHGGLLRRLEAFDLGRDRLRHVAHRLAHALAAVAGVVVVAQLDRLARARRGAGGHHSAAEGARVEPDLDLDRGIAARVEDLARVDGADLGHA